MVEHQQYVVSHVFLYKKNVIEKKNIKKRTNRMFSISFLRTSGGKFGSILRNSGSCNNPSNSLSSILANTSISESR